MAMQEPVSSTRWSAGKTIFWAGFMPGLADYLYPTINTVIHGGSPWQPWKGVAGALVGQAARDGGVAYGLLGILLHFTILFGAAAVFYFIIRRFPWFVARPWITALILGPAFLVVMNYVILPLSLIGRPLYTGVEGLTRAVLMHTLLIGIPMSWFTSRGLRRA